MGDEKNALIYLVLLMICGTILFLLYSSNNSQISDCEELCSSVGLKFKTLGLINGCKCCNLSENLSKDKGNCVFLRLDDYMIKDEE